jgi:hypothetical protein
VAATAPRSPLSWGSFPGGHGSPCGPGLATVFRFSRRQC